MLVIFAISLAWLLLAAFLLGSVLVTLLVVSMLAELSSNVLMRRSPQSRPTTTTGPSDSWRRDDLSLTGHQTLGREMTLWSQRPPWEIAQVEETAAILPFQRQRIAAMRYKEEILIGRVLQSCTPGHH